MNEPPSSSYQCNINCSDNKNDSGTQTIIGLNINNYNHVPPCTDHVSQVPFPPQDSVVGKVSHNIEVVLQWLRESSFHPVGVWGMGGVGKTTLLKSIFNKLLEDPDIAGSAYWVDVSQSCSLYQLQKKIAQAIGVNFYVEESEHRRAASLHHKLVQMKRVVLILDDVWDCFRADQIEVPRGENGCKMIFSTRSKALCKRMGHAEYVLEVQPLTEGEALKLFRSTLENFDELSDDVKEIAFLISKECHRLPLAVKVIAASLKGECDLNTWKCTLYQLRDLDIGHEDMEKEVHRILRISYDRLKGEDLKSCFLNCALYSEYHGIMREELIDLLIMEGSLDYLKDRAMQLSKGYSILNELVNSCLLEPYIGDSGKILTVKMHVLMREMAISITIKEHPRFLAKSDLDLERIPANEHWNKDLVKASLSWNRIREMPCDMSPDTPKLIVLLFNDNENLKEIPESFFVHMKLLRVLDVSFTQIKRLPDSVSDLEDLRMLLLVGCMELKYVPSLTKLSKLLVLCLPFPAYGVKWVGEVPKGMERMKSLEKLTYCQWKTSEVILFNNFIKSVQSLTSYTLGLTDEDLHLLNFSPARMFDEMYYVRHFFINGGKFRDDKEIPQIPRKAQRVSFCNMEITRVDNLVDALPSFAELEELKSLTFYNCRGLEYITTSVAQGKYPSTSQLETLEQLFLEKLPNLIRTTKYGAYCFSHLTKLVISHCPRLEVGLPIKSASNLEIVDVKDCEEMREIFETNDISSSSTSIGDSYFYPIIALSKLEVLYLDDLPKLSSIYRGLLLCTSLKHKKFFGCPQLNLLPLSKPMICNDSPASKASIPNKKDNPEWWEPLTKSYPKGANTLSRFKAFVSVDQESHSDDDEEVSHSQPKESLDREAGVSPIAEGSFSLANESDGEVSNSGNFLCAAVNAFLRALAGLCRRMC